MKIFIPVFAALLTQSAFALEIRIHSTLNPGRAVTVAIPASGKAEYAVDLGEDIFGVLEVVGTDKKDLVVQRRFETSMSLGDEGPHLDLRDWLHYTSDWQKLEPQSGGKFAMQEISQADHKRFPFVSHAQLLDKIRKLPKEKADRWLPVAKKCKTSTSDFCDVSVSRQWVEIYDKDQKKLGEVVFVHPMGC